jgi:hypothetical protein
MALDGVGILNIWTNTKMGNYSVVQSRFINVFHKCEGCREETVGVYYIDWQSDISYAADVFTDVLTAADQDGGYQEDTEADAIMKLGYKVINHRLFFLVPNVINNTAESTQHRHSSDAIYFLTPSFIIESTRIKSTLHFLFFKQQQVVIY